MIIDKQALKDIIKSLRHYLPRAEAWRAQAIASGVDTLLKQLSALEAEIRGYR